VDAFDRPERQPVGLLDDVIESSVPLQRSPRVVLALKRDADGVDNVRECAQGPRRWPRRGRREEFAARAKHTDGFDDGRTLIRNAAPANVQSTASNDSSPNGKAVASPCRCR